MTPIVPVILRLISVLAGIHSAAFLWAMVATRSSGLVVILLGAFGVVSAAAASYGIWKLEGWAMRALLCWAFAAPLFAVTLFAALYPGGVGSSAWRTVLQASLMWLVFMGSAAWQLRSVTRGRTHR